MLKSFRLTIYGCVAEYNALRASIIPINALVYPLSRAHRFDRTGQGSIQRIWRGIGKINTKSKTLNTLRNTIIFCKLQQEINSDEYEIVWQHLSTKIEAQIQEAAALKLYTENFKEPPPLTLKICRQKYLNWGLNYFDQSRWSAEPNKFVKSIISGTNK